MRSFLNDHPVPEALLAGNDRLAFGAMQVLGDRVRPEGKAPWYGEWLAHRDLDDPYWSARQLGPALDRVGVPVLLQTGWQDVFLDQTLEQYTHLNDRGVDVGLTVGPWTHQGTALHGYATLVPETLDWLAQHLDGRGTRRQSPVRVQVTGSDEWRDLTSWPPVTTQRVLHLRPGGALGDRPAPETAASAEFTYDPDDPTPTVGGRGLTESTNGYKDDTKLGKRSDVLTFTGPPLAEPLEVIGVPSVDLAHTTDNPYADVLVRISEVDAKGRSRNVCEGFARLDPADSSGRLELQLDAVAHRFAAGNRVRLMVAGGSFPRYERNLGTDQDPSTSTTMVPSRHTIVMAGSRLLLPVPT